MYAASSRGSRPAAKPEPLACSPAGTTCSWDCSPAWRLPGGFARVLYRTCAAPRPCRQEPAGANRGAPDTGPGIPSAHALPC